MEAGRCFLETNRFEEFRKQLLRLVRLMKPEGRKERMIGMKVLISKTYYYNSVHVRRNCIFFSKVLWCTILFDFCLLFILCCCRTVVPKPYFLCSFIVNT